MTLRIGLLASHDGTNAQAHFDAWERGLTPAEPVLLISNNPGSGALERARRRGIDHALLNAKTHPDDTARDIAIGETLANHKVDLVLLCGYMKKIGAHT